MSEWKKVKLGNVVSIKSGLSYKSEFIGKGDNLLLGMGCVSYKESFLDSGVRPYSQDCDPKYIAVPGDLVLATRQQSDNLPILAMPAIIPEKYQGKKIIIGTNLYRVENNSDIDNRFLFFVLKSHDYVNYIRGVKTGTTVQMVSKRNVEEYIFLCPPKETREHIVSILSRYDSLIENYQKQIKLLEEAAQRLYKEWFVDLHFPGHENTKIVDGVPKGWEKKKVGDLIAKSQRTKQVPANDYLKTGNIPVIDQGKNYIAGYTNDNECIVNVTTPYIVFGDHTRVLKYIPFSFAKGADGTQLIMSNNMNRMPQSLLYNSLINIDLSNYSYARHFKYLKEEEIIVPTTDVSMKYDVLVSKYYQSVQNSREQIRLLTEARDRLLPKLMSGEIKM